MSKQTFSYIIILMGLSIVGIILVQIVWINNAIEVRNDLFNRSINEVLNRAAERLEDEQNFRIFTRADGADSLQRVKRNSPPLPRRQIRMIRDKQHKSPARVEIVDDSSGIRTHSFTFSDANNKQIQTETIVVASRDTVLSDTKTFIDQNRQRLDSIDRFLDSLKTISPGLHQRIELKANNLHKFSNRVISELSELDRSMPAPEEIRAALSHELTHRDIPIDFEFAISEHDTIRYLSEDSDSLALLESPFQVPVFPYAIFSRETKLHVYFPNQGRHLYRSISWLLAASLIFSLIILLTFGLSILFMLRQKKISEMKTDFINNMTHEFKTPIATISVAADSIRNEKVIHQPERINFYVDMIKKENNRMNRQVEDILTIARLDKKEFEFRWESVNIHQLIEDVSESIRLQVDKRGGQLLMQLDAANPVVTSDRSHCANLIYNLLDNANKYSTDVPQITITTQNTTKGLIISVSDKGIGMTKTVQSRIFERFYRQTSGNIHNVKGFGLGLSYVRAVVEANKGTIQVRSDIGKGSCFDIFLPFVRE
ncbi:sensor histidine kinase [Mangrovibacterium sp.]|uniref:sensor histidine kinase n=1 Tax=Mangrovibacterium sp. TaxID=1961364 RepID=UPI0035664FEC